MSVQEPNQKGTVLVTGGSGFLGGRCIAQLLEQGYSVRTTVRSQSRAPSVESALSGELGYSPEVGFFEADLGGDAGWEEAVRGCDYVLHVASPFPPSQPKDPQELIVPARDGALRVLKSALAAGTKRVVLTSSTVAVRNGATPPLNQPYTEENWTDPELPGLSPYGQSKTIAERAAWDLVKETGDTKRLAVVNPSAILGPLLGEEDSSSLQIIQRMLDGMPGVPRLGFSFVDVRDVADLHIRAMTSPEAGGQRFISSGPFLWLSEVSEILREGLPEEASKAPTRIVPKPLVRLMGLFDPSIRSVIDDIGKEAHFSVEKAKDVLGWEPRPIEETIVDCGRSLAAHEA
ncbi:MAG: SDR family oxidoreductase [Solirubrobacterales bacterium]